MTNTPVIEAQLLRWSESHNGRTVTLQLPSDGEHPFRGLPCGPANGARLAIAIARINDDETTTPVEPPSTAPEKPKGGDNGQTRGLARQAAIACADKRFQAFLRDEFHFTVTDADEAKMAVYDICDVPTRKRFNTDPEAAERWNSLYTKYLVENR